METRSTATRTEDAINPHRLTVLAAAAELQVDEEDIDFQSPQEAEIWQSLRTEFEELVSKIGPVWIAD